MKTFAISLAVPQAPVPGLRAAPVGAAATRRAARGAEGHGRLLRRRHRPGVRRRQGRGRGKTK